MFRLSLPCYRLLNRAAIASNLTLALSVEFHGLQFRTRRGSDVRLPMPANHCSGCWGDARTVRKKRKRCRMSTVPATDTTSLSRARFLTEFGKSHVIFAFRHGFCPEPSHIEEQRFAKHGELVPQSEFAVIPVIGTRVSRYGVAWA